jgi:hypothetical protein
MSVFWYHCEHLSHLFLAIHHCVRVWGSSLLSCIGQGWVHRHHCHHCCHHWDCSVQGAVGGAPQYTLCYVSFYPENRSFGKDVGFNLMGCAPNVLLVLSIYGALEYQNSVGRTWSNDQSRSRRSGSRESEDKVSEVRDVRMSEKVFKTRGELE